MYLHNSEYEYKPIKRKRGRPRMRLDNPNVQEALGAYSNGMPKYVVAYEYQISEPTLRRLIIEHESIYGKLRQKTRIRYH